jgi:hypothetical protein
LCQKRTRRLLRAGQALWDSRYEARRRTPVARPRPLQSDPATKDADDAYGSPEFLAQFREDAGFGEKLASEERCGHEARANEKADPAAVIDGAP